MLRILVQPRNAKAMQALVYRKPERTSPVLCDAKLYKGNHHHGGPQEPTLVVNPFIATMEADKGAYTRPDRHRLYPIECPAPANARDSAEKGEEEIISGPLFAARAVSIAASLRVRSGVVCESKP